MDFRWLYKQQNVIKIGAAENDEDIYLFLTGLSAEERDSTAKVVAKDISKYLLPY